MGSRLYGEPKLDCGINVNVSSLRLNMAPRWSLGRRMMICTELKMVTAALGDQGEMAAFSSVCLTLYEIGSSPLGSGSTGPQKCNYPHKLKKKELVDDGCRKSEISRNLFALCGHDRRFPPCLLELLRSLSNQSLQQRHLLLTAIIFILESSFSACLASKQPTFSFAPKIITQLVVWSSATVIFILHGA